MPFSRFVFSSSVLLILAGSVLSSALQNPPAPIDDAFVHSQFGSNCSLIGMAPLIADLDGDGVEDIAIPAKCTSPMMDQVENTYSVVDPYDSYFGYGNPAVTTQFASEDPTRRGYSLLIIHGAGPDAWRSMTPKAKFLVVNVPFKEVSVKKLAFKKRVVKAIYVDETGGDAMMSAIFWDGKKYRYEPMGSSLE